MVSKNYISIVPKLLFFKTTALYMHTYSLNMQTTKKSSTWDKKWNFHFAINYSKCLQCLTVSLSTQILILVIMPLSLSSVNILCELAMLPDMYILLFPQEEEVHCSSWGNKCTHMAAHSSKRLNLLTVIILVCISNT